MAGRTRSDDIVVSGGRRWWPLGRRRRDAGRRSKGARRRIFTGRNLARFALVSLLLVTLVALVPPLRKAAALGLSRVILAVSSPFAPDIGNFDDLPQPSRVVSTDGVVLAELDGGERREPARLADLPPHVPRAVLAAEDANFYEHGGVDPSAVIRAVIRTSQGERQGGSTITQQLAKINYTNSERTVLRKLREVQYAARLEKEYTKDQLLERYLNQVYFGDGAYGIAAAAQVYYGVPPAQLTAEQAATLAGKIRSPEGLDPHRDPAAVQARRDGVLRNMRRHDWLTAEEIDAARATPLAVLPERPGGGAGAPFKAPHFVEYVKREAARLDALGGSPESANHALVAGGYTIETTLNAQWYDQAATTVQGTLGGPADPATAVVSVEPGNGAIRVLFGGLAFDRKFDVASQGRRQPGSSFKPYVYLAAIRDGISPRSRLRADSPMTLGYKGGTFTVKNYEGEGRGESDIDNATVHSINVVYSQLALEVGLDDVVRTAKAAGVREDAIDVDRDNPAIALGGLTKGVTPLEQAAGFATFAARGVYAEPYAIGRIRDRQGKVVYTAEPKTREAFDRKEVGVLNSALQGVVEQGTGRAAAIARPVAGKTGTTENHGDAWFVGFIPQLSTAVWVGYPDEVRPMTSVHGIRVSGGSFPARIWSGYMTQAVAGLPIRPIDTARPEELSLRMLGEGPPLPPQETTTTSAPPSTTSSSTTTSSSSTTTTTAPATTTTTAKKTGRPTTTTTASTTTTTASSSGSSSAGTEDGGSTSGDPPDGG